MAESCGEPYDSSDEYDRDERIETIYQGWGAREMAERIVELEDELGADVDGICTGMHADVAEAHAEIDRQAAKLRVLEGDCIRLSDNLDDAREANAELARDVRDGAHWEGVADRMRAEIRRLTSLVGYWEHRAEEATGCDRYRSAWLSARRRAKWARRYADSDLRFTRNMWSDALRDLNRYRSAWLSARRRAADEANFGMEALERKEREVSRWRSGHEIAEAQLVKERRENARLRSFADEVKGVHYSCRDGEPDCAERFLKRVYDSMYELWDAEREKRPFVDRVQRCAARGEFDDVTEDESRETTDAPRLECVGVEEDGGTVWRLAAGPRIR